LISAFLTNPLLLNFVFPVKQKAQEPGPKAKLSYKPSIPARNGFALI